jgi:hypothetical protein
VTVGVTGRMNAQCVVVIGILASPPGTSHNRFIRLVQIDCLTRRAYDVVDISEGG